MLPQVKVSVTLLRQDGERIPTDQLAKPVVGHLELGRAGSTAGRSPFRAWLNEEPHRYSRLLPDLEDPVITRMQGNSFILSGVEVSWEGARVLAAHRQSWLCTAVSAAQVVVPDGRPPVYER